MELDKRIRYSFSGNYINDPENGGVFGQLFDLVELTSNRARTYHRILGLCRKREKGKSLATKEHKRFSMP